MRWYNQTLWNLRLPANICQEFQSFAFPLPSCTVRNRSVPTYLCLCAWKKNYGPCHLLGKNWIVLKYPMVLAPFCVSGSGPPIKLVTWTRYASKNHDPYLAWHPSITLNVLSLLLPGMPSSPTLQHLYRISFCCTQCVCYDYVKEGSSYENYRFIWHPIKLIKLDDLPSVLSFSGANRGHVQRVSLHLSAGLFLWYKVQKSVC